MGRLEDNLGVIAYILRVSCDLSSSIGLIYINLIVKHIQVDN